MSFDLDDPLADILSRGSDDSFFDDDLLGKKKNPNKTNLLASRKSAVFNLDEDTKPPGYSYININETNKKEIVHRNLEPTPGTEAQRDTTRKNLKTSTKSKDLDIGLTAPKDKNLESLESLDRSVTPKIDPHSKSVEKRKSSISILDDLLGTSSMKTYAETQTSTAKSDFNFKELLGKQNIETQKKCATAVSKPSIQTDLNKPDRAVKNVSVAAESTKRGSDEWLGIFDKEPDQEKTDSVYDPGMSAWLLGNDIQLSKSSAPISKPKTSEVPQTDVSKVNSTHCKDTVKKMPTELKRSLETILQPPVATASMLRLGNAMMESKEDIAQEGAALCMQQQESQLMLALQLREQEEKLSAIQKRQAESKKIQSQASSAQQAQLAAMLETQAAHRLQMQAIITAHQQRINQRIKFECNGQALLTPMEPESGEGGPESDTAGSESLHAKEKRQLLQLVDTLLENHQKEMDLMETSYRRQLAITEAELVQWEVRKRAESDRLTRHYTQRLEWAESEAREERARAQAEARAAAERYERLLGSERSRSAETAKLLQEQHAALMDNIKWDFLFNFERL